MLVLCQLSFAPKCPENEAAWQGRCWMEGKLAQLLPQLLLSQFWAVCCDLFSGKNMPGVCYALTNFGEEYWGPLRLCLLELLVSSSFLIVYCGSFIALLNVLPECWVILVEPNLEKCGVSGFVGLTWKGFRSLLSALAEVQRLQYMFWHFLKSTVQSKIDIALEFYVYASIAGLTTGKTKSWNTKMWVPDPPYSVVKLLF
jgi:hypothetical protein